MGNKITVDSVLFFDMDGTLIDTNHANFLSYQKAIISVTKSDDNLTFNPDERFNRNNLKDLIPNLTEDQLENIIQKKEECYNEFLHKTELRKDIADILFRYSKTNKTVLVTNSHKDRAMATLDHFGLTNHFDEIFCQEFTGDDQNINKFKSAIFKLGISPSFVVAFENEEAEIINAIQAGIEMINPAIG